MGPSLVGSGGAIAGGHASALEKVKFEKLKRYGIGAMNVILATIQPAV